MHVLIPFSRHMHSLEFLESRVWIHRHVHGAERERWVGGEENVGSCLRFCRCNLAFYYFCFVYLAYNSHKLCLTVQYTSHENIHHNPPLLLPPSLNQNPNPTHAPCKADGAALPATISAAPQSHTDIVSHSYSSK